MRYVGRHGTTDAHAGTIGDDRSGPDTIRMLADADHIRIEDARSFPWELAAQLSAPFDVDLGTMSADDMTATLPMLGVLTPEDSVTGSAASDVRDALGQPAPVTPRSLSTRHADKRRRIDQRALWRRVIDDQTTQRPWRTALTWIDDAATSSPDDVRWLETLLAPAGWVDRIPATAGLGDEYAFLSVPADSLRREHLDAVQSGGSIAVRYGPDATADHVIRGRALLAECWGPHRILHTAVTCLGADGSTAAAIEVHGRLRGSGPT